MNSTILAIDDDPDILDSLQLALEMEGYTVVTASQDTKFASLIEETQPDIVLLDYLLSGTTGLDIASELKDCGVEAPMILMTAHPKMSLDAGKNLIDDLLPKPFSIEALLKIVEKHLVGRASEERD